MAPQANQAAADRQHAQIQDAIAKAAVVLAGGGKPEGCVVPPTVLADITPEMRIHAEDLRPGLAVAERIRTRVMHVNDQPVNDEPFAPFGGIQNSGYGKFGGDAGIESFTEARWVTMQKEGHAPIRSEM